MQKSIKKNGMLLVMALFASMTVAFAIDPKDGSNPSSQFVRELDKTRNAPPLIAEPLIELKFDFDWSSALENAGTAQGSFVYTHPIPTVTTNAVTGGTALDFGTTPANYYVESHDPIYELGALYGFTITGWLNCKSSTTGTGGNRVISWINDGGHGVDVVYKSNGSLQMGINAWASGSPAVSSAGKIPTSATGDSSNWVFFAITYDASTSQVAFYFGNTTNAATLDVTRTYARDIVGPNVGDLAIGHYNDATRLKSGALSRMFRGAIDQVTVYGSALTSTDIVGIQQENLIVDTEPPTPPVVTLLSKTYNSVTLGWSGAADNGYLRDYYLYSSDEYITASPATITTATITGLSPNTAYNFTVKALDGAHNTSASSNIINVTTDGAETSNTNAGYRSLFSNSSGTKNTAIGGYTLENNSSGHLNTAVGFEALVLNTTGTHNVSMGGESLSKNTTGTLNTAAGYDALSDNTTAHGNTAFGGSALTQNITGSGNTAVGVNALAVNRYGNNNTALGNSSGFIVGSPNLVGAPEVSNTTAIGHNTYVTASNQVRLGNSDVISIGGQVSWSTLSDGRFKKDLKKEFLFCP